ncbi:flagellar hook assembly protein FlgD [Paraburkholderia phosphatilytica]|uniref:flagellar hook assembly protein FlgD n=1 Tax=Paraburkholderia phosphatilytica TaxID=2282883 RepID=UPI000E48E687|nr:flagellar hook assembly protein FlgD [Paraburkholderia phosphatilytica]
MTTNTTIGGSGTTVSQTLLDTMNGTSASSASSSSSTSSTSGQNLQTTFLQLLVTQLQNQDPTNPMDSSQMTSQLAQIDTVTGVSQLNTSLTSLASQLSAGQNAQAALLIGSTVLAPSSSGFSVSSGTAPELGVSLPAAASDVTLTIKNSSGSTVRTVDLGAESAGTTTYTWDGKDNSGNTVADGKYTVTAAATVNGSAGTATALAAGTVQSVVQQSDGSAGLALSNGSTVPLSSVASIL